MADPVQKETPTPTEMDRVARVIAAAIWRPSPDMSGDIWRVLSALERRKAEMAAVSAIEEMRRE